MKAFRPVLFLTLILLVVGLACSALTGGGDTPPQVVTEPPVQVVTDEPVQVISSPTTAPEPTDVPSTQAPPAVEAPPEAQDFYVEEFEGDYNPENWQYFTLGDGDEDNLVIEQQDDHLLFDLGDEDLYVYFMYAAYTYENVSLTLNAENRGRNNNNVSLICRMNDEGTQWYEFSVESGGVWYLYAFDDKYNILDNGGTNSLNQGRAVNEYRLDCSGDEITMYINGDKIKTVQDTRYLFDDGFVGFNISSLNVLPITVEVNSFEIDFPE
jgi:hypothetical protein